MRTTLGITLLAATLAAFCTGSKAAPLPEEPKPIFPLSKGSAWTYQGTAKWTRPDSGQVVEKSLTWKMEITETLRRGHVLAAVLKGHPADVAHFQEGKAPGNYLIVQVGSAKLYLLREDRVPEALARLRDEQDALHGLVREEEIFLDAPLVAGKIFGEAAQLTRGDGSYCWVVEAEAPAQLQGIKGIGAANARTCYRLIYRTRPDHTETELVPGIGITRYVYVHHGTVAETDVKLVEYRQGE